MSQEPVLFDASIKNNILMGLPDATEEMVFKAAKNANAHDFITQLPNVCTEYYVYYLDLWDYQFLLDYRICWILFKNGYEFIPKFYLIY